MRHYFCGWLYIPRQLQSKTFFDIFHVWTKKSNAPSPAVIQDHIEMTKRVATTKTPTTISVYLAVLEKDSFLLRSLNSHFKTVQTFCGFNFWKLERYTEHYSYSQNSPGFLSEILRGPLKKTIQVLVSSFLLVWTKWCSLFSKAESLKFFSLYEKFRKISCSYFQVWVEKGLSNNQNLLN